MNVRVDGFAWVGVCEPMYAHGHMHISLCVCVGGGRGGGKATY